MVANLPDLFLMSLKSLDDCVCVQLPEKQLAFFSAEYHVLVTWQNSHAHDI